MSILDELEGGQDYHLDVAVIDVDEARERELNVRLNNVGLMGSYDFAKLDAMLDTPGLKADTLGFDAIDLQAMFPDRGGLFDKSKDATQPTIDALKALKEEGKPGKTLQGIKDQERAYKAAKKADGSYEYYLVAVFGDRAEMDEFLKAAKLPLDDKHVDGRKLATLLGLDL